ncbi:hypothetical protein RsoM2USA_27 [Ralstonia phage RsoM2USA]|nr:hypothetical protein RsoM2USA_27 [Ralstonia phage RsoM2USA]
MITEIWRVHGDGGEFSDGPVIGYFTKETDADKFAFGKGWYGGKGRVSKGWAIQIGYHWYELADSSPIDLDRKKTLADEQLKKDTLASLSAEQKRVLGLT